MLLDAGGDGEDVRVDDDVLGREPCLADEQVVGAPQDLDLPLHRLGLATLVERHHDDTRAVAPHLARLGEEVLLALLERDRVDDPLPLDALEARDCDLPARAVDHHGHPSPSGSVASPLRKRRHRRDAVEQVGVHVHVEQVRAATHLVERDVERPLPVVRLDEAAERGRPGHVRPLADDHERRILVDDERLETAESRSRRARRDRPRGSPCTAAAMAATCSGVVPQQPPTPFTSPSSANARSDRAVCSAVSS